MQGGFPFAPADSFNCEGQHNHGGPRSGCDLFGALQKSHSFVTSHADNPRLGSQEIVQPVPSLKWQCCPAKSAAISDLIEGVPHGSTATSSSSVGTRHPV